MRIGLRTVNYIKGGEPENKLYSIVEFPRLFRVGPPGHFLDMNSSQS